MVGLPNTRVIPAGWEAHHQPAAEGAMTAECVITRLATTSATRYNAATGRTDYPDPTTVYSGACRMQREVRSQDHARDVGGNAVTARRYLVSIPTSADPVQINDIVTISAATDADMIGKKLRVTDVRGGSLLWQHDLSCEEWETTTR